MAFSSNAAGKDFTSGLSDAAKQGRGQGAPGQFARMRLDHRGRQAPGATPYVRLRPEDFAVEIFAEARA